MSRATVSLLSTSSVQVVPDRVFTNTCMMTFDLQESNSSNSHSDDVLKYGQLATVLHYLSVDRSAECGVQSKISTSVRGAGGSVIEAWR